MRTPPCLCFTNGNYQFIYQLVQGDNVIGSHLKEFNTDDGTQIPLYALKIEIDKDFNMELEVMNTHFGTKNLEFGKFKSDNWFRQIKPGRVYIAELDDTLGYRDTEIRIMFKDSLLQHQNQLDDIINAPTQVAPKVLPKAILRAEEKKEPRITDDLLNAETQVIHKKSLDILDEPTQVNPKPIMKKVKIEEEKHPQPSAKRNSLFDLINAPTQIVGGGNRLEKDIKKVGFLVPEGKQDENVHKGCSCHSDSSIDEEIQEKNIFTATNAPTQIVIPMKIPKQQKPRLNEIEKLNEDDFDGPTQVLNTHKPLANKEELKEIKPKKIDQKDEGNLIQISLIFYSYRKFVQIKNTKINLNINSLNTNCIYI